MNSIEPSAEHHYHFVTGRLAESALRSIVAPLAEQFRFDHSVSVMPITVAALMTPKWLLKHLHVPAEATHVILPGYCETGGTDLAEVIKTPVFFGPKDVRALPEWFGGKTETPDLSSYTTEIIAEINHAPRQSIEDVVSQALTLRSDGADVIDLGCDPAARCESIGDYVTALIDQGLRVSIDTFDAWEAATAIRQGASLVLSVNSTNAAAAVDWGCEVVVVPDTPTDQKSFLKTIDYLSSKSVPMRLDPILEPLGGGFVASLQRYSETRRLFPDIAMMMGIGNVTELTDADSAGINLLLLGICEELQINSVLTTQVINWGRTSVRECDLARRLVHYSVRNGIPPKRLSDQLVILRDDRLRAYPDAGLEALAAQIKDHNYRLFAQDGLIHVLSAGLQISGTDPFELFEQMTEHTGGREIDPGHAFYLGFEMAKAATALTLHKQYEQDESLQWGFLTQAENLHRLKRRRRSDGSSKSQ